MQKNLNNKPALITNCGTKMANLHKSPELLKAAPPPPPPPPPPHLPKPVHLYSWMKITTYFAVLGFIPSDFIGIERRVGFTLRAGYLSGKPPSEDALYLQLRHGTSGMPSFQTLLLLLSSITFWFLFNPLVTYHCRST